MTFIHIGKSGFEGPGSHNNPCHIEMNTTFSMPFKTSTEGMVLGSIFGGKIVSEVGEWYLTRRCN